MARGKSVTSAKEQMPLPDVDVELPERAEHALSKKTIVKEWGINPWEIDRLTVKDMQDIALAEHAESYIQQEQRDRSRSDSISKSEYDVANSRKEAFGFE